MPPRSSGNRSRLHAQKLGLKRVLVTCDDDNVGSIKTIEKNGGVLESIVTGPDGDKPKRRYWIATAQLVSNHL